MQDDNGGGLWAIVEGAGGKKYVGVIESEAGTPVRDPIDLIGDSPIRMTHAWAYIEMDLPAQRPDGLAMSHVTHCRPVHNCLGAASFYITPVLIHLFEDMEEAEQKRNKDIVREVAQAAVVKRAEAVGLSLASSMSTPVLGGPHGPGRPPGL